jgi:dTDP-4-amino-4,6-dideoxygalactose transaminase
MPDSYYFDKYFENWSSSNVTTKILMRIDPEQVIKNRRKNYKYLFRRISTIPNCNPLFENIPEGICPLGLLVKVPKRSLVSKALNAHGIASFPWWEGYHNKFSWDGFPEAQYLKNCLLYLPVNQSLNLMHMDYIASCLKIVINQLTKSIRNF